MADWLAAAYNVSQDGVAVWEQRRFSNLLRATPRPVRSALGMSSQRWFALCRLPTPPHPQADLMLPISLPAYTSVF